MRIIRALLLHLCDQRPVSCSPYKYGYITEVKHYSMGRVSSEMSLVMPDQRTVYITDDGDNRGFYKYVADNAGDLTAGNFSIIPQSCVLRHDHVQCYMVRSSTHPILSLPGLGRSAGLADNTKRVVCPGPLAICTATECAVLPTTGTLYAAKVTQKSAVKGGNFDIAWVKLGNATDALLQTQVG